MAAQRVLPTTAKQAALQQTATQHSGHTPAALRDVQFEPTQAMDMVQLAASYSAE
jgi:hypothetical protein